MGDEVEVIIQFGSEDVIVKSDINTYVSDHRGVLLYLAGRFHGSSERPTIKFTVLEEDGTNLND